MDKHRRVQADKAPLAELAEQNQRYRVILFAIGLIAVTIAIYLFVTWAQGRLHPGPLLVTVLQDVASTTFSLAVVGVGFEWWNRKRSEQQLRTAIVDAMVFSDDVLGQLTHDAKFAYIRRMLRAMLGERRGSALYDAYIGPFTGRSHAETLFRSSFKYSISFLPPDDDVPGGPIDLRRYHRVAETLEYEKPFVLPSPELRHEGLFIVSALREEQLQPYFSDARCIYRSVLGLEDDDRLQLSQADDPLDFIAPYHQVVHVRINNEMAQTRVVYEDGVFKTYLSGYDLLQTEDAEEDELAEGPRVHFHIVIETLHARQQNYYSVYLAEPSRAPEITFQYNSQMEDVSCLRFLSGIMDEDVQMWNHPGSRQVALKVKPHKWVFPTSGIVFIWKDRRALPGGLASVPPVETVSSGLA